MNKLVIQIATIGWSKILLISALMAGFYYAAVFDDGSEHRTKLNAQNQALAVAKKQLQETKDAVASAERFEREVKDTVDHFNTVVPQLMPEEVSAADLMAVLSDASSKSGAKLVKTEPRPGVEKADFYDTTRIALSLEGKFSQVVLFLASLSRVPKIMTFQSLELSSEDDSGTVEAPKLAFNGVLTAYKYVKRKADGKDAINKAKPGDANAKAP